MTQRSEGQVRARSDWDLSLRRVLTAVIVLPIRLYQRLISPLFGPTCRFHPSCSAYALDAVRVHGPLKGSLLAIWRLLRCNPWSAGGIDHVPHLGEWRGGNDVRATSHRVGS
jgi:putative membrane protein insertion efficiency factor